MDKNKKLFPQRLWELIHNEEYNFCLRWSDDGQRVYLNRAEFETHYLRSQENQFHTQKAISFVRQMNIYGFRKVDDCYYENENFRRDCPQLLKNMVRRHSNKSLAPAPPPPTSKRHFRPLDSFASQPHLERERAGSVQPLYRRQKSSSVVADLDRLAACYRSAALGGPFGGALASVQLPLASTLYHRLAALSFGTGGLHSSPSSSSSPLLPISLVQGPQQEPPRDPQLVSPFLQQQPVLLHQQPAPSILLESLAGFGSASALPATDQPPAPGLMSPLELVVNHAQSSNNLDLRHHQDFAGYPNRCARRSSAADFRGFGRQQLHELSSDRLSDALFDFDYEQLGTRTSSLRGSSSCSSVESSTLQQHQPHQSQQQHQQMLQQDYPADLVLDLARPSGDRAREARREGVE